MLNVNAVHTAPRSIKLGGWVPTGVNHPELHVMLAHDCVLHANPVA